MEYEEVFYYAKTIKSSKGEDLFKKYKVSEEDIKRYIELIGDGKEDEAINDFIEKYVITSIQTYRNELNYYVEAGTSGEIDRKNSIIMYSSIIALSNAFKKTTIGNMSNFLGVFSKRIFIEENLSNPAIKNAILESTLSRFNELTEGAMSQTQASILSVIRDSQREFIRANQTIIKNDLKGSELQKFVDQFKIDIQKRIPGLKRYSEKGIILDRAGRSFDFDNYFEMSTSTTALNIKRHAVEYMAETEQDEILLYYLADNRKLKTTQREICKSVLSKKIDGYSFVALTERASKILGIKLLSTVKERGGLGPWCRHAIKRVDKKMQANLLMESA